MGILARHSLSIGAATALLAGCGGSQPPIGAPGVMAQSHAGASLTTRIPTDLYVVDQWTKRVIEFDKLGKRIAARDIKPWSPSDVVTDRHGNVYVLGYRQIGRHEFEYAVQEFSHDLGTTLAFYSLNGTLSSHLTIDGADNLYVLAYNDQLGDYVAEYPYGTTTMSRAYKIGLYDGFCSDDVGISIDGNVLVAAMGSLAQSRTCVIPCQIGGKCSSGKLIVGFEACGIATTRRFAAYGWYDIVHRYLGHSAKHRGFVNLPYGYYLGNNLFCNLHNHGEFVWGGMRTGPGSKPAFAVEFDMVHKKISAMVGGKDLHTPIAAFYGNGYVP